ncbi:MAG: sugar ABC transporter substrate-binding protein [Herbinix sp.]|nr:sugar ABC transporter substrate-binding protein [Herbinix sp.]
MKRNLVVLILSVILVLSSVLLGCSNSKESDEPNVKTSTGNEDDKNQDKNSPVKDQEEENDDKKKGYSIGYTCPTLNNPFFVGMMDGAQLASDEREVKLTMLGGDNDVTKQVAQIEDFISQGVDAIVVQAVDTTGIVTAVEEANEAGIPVFTTAETPTGGDIVCSISFDSYESGYNGGTYIADVLGGEGKVVELVGVLGQETSREKSRGFAEAIEKFDGIEILSSQPAEYDRATAMNIMENWLQTYDQIDAVYAANDEMALGAMQAIEAAGINDIFVMGNDGTDEALEAVIAGTLGATNGTPGYIQGYIAIDIAVRYLNGEAVPATIKERNTVIDASNIDNAEQILKGVSEKDWYWLEQFN